MQQELRPRAVEKATKHEIQVTSPRVVGIDAAMTKAEQVKARLDNLRRRYGIIDQEAESRGNKDDKGSFYYRHGTPADIGVPGSHLESPGRYHPQGVETSTGGRRGTRRRPSKQSSYGTRTSLGRTAPAQPLIPQKDSDNEQRKGSLTFSRVGRGQGDKRLRPGNRREGYLETPIMKQLSQLGMGQDFAKIMHKTMLQARLAEKKLILDFLKNPPEPLRPEPTAYIKSSVPGLDEFNRDKSAFFKKLDETLKDSSHASDSRPLPDPPTHT
jgi:hypothetical protein